MTVNMMRNFSTFAIQDADFFGPSTSISLSKMFSRKHNSFMLLLISKQLKSSVPSLQKMILFTFLMFETAVCLHFVLTNSKTPIWKLWAVFPRCWCYSCIGPYTFYLGTLLGKIGYNIPKRLSTKGQRHKSTERLNMKLWYLLLWHTWLLFDRLEHWVYFVRKNYLLCNYTANRVKRKISTLPSGVTKSN